MKIKRVTVKKNERGILPRNGDFERVLQAGTHWLWDGIDTLRVETFALEQPAFTHGLADYLMAKEPRWSRPSSCTSSAAKWAGEAALMKQTLARYRVDEWGEGKLLSPHFLGHQYSARGP